MNDHRRIDLRIVENGADGGGEPRRIRIAHDVGGIGARPCGRHDGVEPRDGLGGEFGELAAERGEFVHRQNAQSAAIGENGEPVAGEGRDAAQRLRRGE